MTKLSAVALMTLALVFTAAGQGRGRGGAGARGAAAGADPRPPTVFMGCAAGGNLQPVEQPVVLEPSTPFLLIDVLNRDATGFMPTNYRITGLTMTPWLGMRVRVEGTLVEPPAGATGVAALPEIKATRVTSMWGSCPSPAAWTPPTKR